MSMLKKTLISAGVAASVIGMGSAHASAYFTVNSGYGTTSAFNVLESNVNATSLYTSLIGPVGSFDDLIGSLTLVTDTSANGNVTGFLSDTTQLLDANDGGFGSNFSMLFSYNLSGYAAIIDGAFGSADGTMDANNNGRIDPSDAIIPYYQTGTISITYKDLTGTALGSIGATQEVLRLNMTSVDIEGVSVVLNADVDYSWYTDGSSSLVENMFHFVGNSDSWYQQWKTGTSTDPITIHTYSDFNINPNYVPISTCGTGVDCQTFTRTTNLNITTSVPEPGTMALMGLGLLGLGLARRRKA
jgi:hypothetical protein